jgi:hypothetical protein
MSKITVNSFTGKTASRAICNAEKGIRLTDFIYFLFFSLSLVSCGDPSDLELLRLISWDESVNDRFNSSMEWNKKYLDSIIIVPSDNYQIYCMADSHIGSTADEHEPTTVNFDKILTFVKTDKPAAFVIAGDLGTGREKDNLLVHEHLSEVLIPQFFMVGNHDLFFDGWDSFLQIFGSSSFYLTIQTPVAKDLFICLDNGNGTLGSKQVKWLREILKTVRPGCRHCIVFAHNNLFRIPQKDLSEPPVSTPPIEELNLLLDFFARYEVNAFISGHGHETQKSITGTTRNIVIGTCLDGSDYPGFLKLQFQDGEIAYIFISI